MAIPVFTPEQLAAYDKAIVDAVRDAVVEALGEALDCTRTWNAWSCGTMTDADFHLVADCSERVDEIVYAALGAVWKGIRLTHDD